MLVREFLAKNKIISIPQPLYSPDLAVADFFPCPKLQTEIKGKSKQEQLAIPNGAFQKCFEDWKKRWHKCIIFERSYFEGNKIVIVLKKNFN